MQLILTIIGALVIVALLAYLISLILRIQAVKKTHQLAQQQRFANIRESIEIIIDATLNERCDLSEGTYRLKPLCDVLGIRFADYPRLNAFYQVIGDMPVKDERLALSAKERKRLDSIRFAALKEHHSYIISELKALERKIKSI